MLTSYIPALLQGDHQALARCITAVENGADGYEQLLEQLPVKNSSSSVGRHTRMIGLTGPPGAGKSTLIDALIMAILAEKKRIAILAVDPSSPFHQGALLGDRIRMSRHYQHPDVFIRSLATRGSVGGLHPKIIEISDLIRAAGFDYLFIETVGVGQNEVEIAGLADTTIVILVPESGDEIQTMKAGLMEIADIFVVNKSDHGQAGDFAKNLRIFTRHRKNNEWEIPVIKTIATEQQGIPEIIEKIKQHDGFIDRHTDRKARLLAERAWQLIVADRMGDVNRLSLQKQIEDLLKKDRFNLYTFVRQHQQSR